jgi:sugar-specific transcriptional regulator TrmB
MVLNDELLKKLRNIFNLNIYEVKVWTALLSKGTATAGELSDMSNVPRSRSYDVLESLEKKGFIIMKLGRPIRYLAVPPQEIVKRVKKNVEEKAQRQIKNLEKVQGTDVFTELNSLFKNGVVHVDPSTIAGSFKGRDNLYNHILETMEKASKEVFVVTTADGLQRKVEYMKSTFRKLHQNKISVKIAAPLNTEKAKEAAKELEDYADVKDLDLGARFIIVDGKDLIFMVNDDKNVAPTSEVGIWVNTPFFSQALSNMFDSVWKK